MLHPAKLPVNQLLDHCRVQRTRRSGPGGQHRNKVETAIVVEHLPTGIRGEASERRSQLQNRQQAIHRLRLKLALKVRCPLSKSMGPLWKSRNRGGRLSINSAHDDFPTMLADALDVLCAHDFSLQDAAGYLGINTSQLVKLLKLHREALVLVNSERQARGKSILH